jgi:hypothetical protein
MKTIICSLFAVVLLAPTSLWAQAQPSTLSPQSGARLQLDSLERLTKLATEVVNITVDPEMLKFALPFLNQDPKQAAVKEMLSSLRGIYVRSFEFAQDTSFAGELDEIRKQLTAPGWSRLITVDSKQNRELVEVYSFREGNASGGLAIVVAEPTELTIVNIVGPLDLSKLGALEGQFGIPRIPRE